MLLEFSLFGLSFTPHSFVFPKKGSEFWNRNGRKICESSTPGIAKEQCFRRMKATNLSLPGEPPTDSMTKATTTILQTQSPPNGRNSGKRKPRRRNVVFLGLSAVIGICYLAENISWFVSINKNMVGDPLKQHEQHEKSYTDVGDDSHSAFCLLIKDDNDILSEWVAYHYHVFQMRRLIVAVDPDSKTSPLDVLEAWGPEKGYFDLDFTIWNDEDYTPDYFHSKSADYSKLPNSVKSSVFLVNPSEKLNSDQLNDPILRTDWHKNTTWVAENQEQVRKEVFKINNHRFRQKNFVSECFRQIKEEQPTSSASWFSPKPMSWVVHIDTDEYLVPNPWIASYVSNETNNDLRKDALQAMLPTEPSEGSLWSLFSDFMGNSASSTGCVMMPRILFGAKEDKKNESPITTISGENDSTNNKTSSMFTWNHSNFESLRWQYHADFESKARPKSMVNIAVLKEDASIFQTKLAVSIHRPLRHTCPAEPLRIQNENQLHEPIAVYHYLGSMERYLARNDARREASIHRRSNKKGSFAKGDENFPDKVEARWWIGGWLDSFVRFHGGEKAFMVLGELYGRQE